MKSQSKYFPYAEVWIPAGGIELIGDLTIPPEASGIVAFAHGSGSSRHSPRNRYVAAVLQRAGLATLLMDLLTSAEEEVDDATGELRFDIELLAERLIRATDWLAIDERTQGLGIGFFGASTGGAAALIAASRRQAAVQAVVSRGGRPDLALGHLAQVTIPTLLIVGGEDRAVIEMNREAYAALNCEKALEIVPGATHLFQEPGTLERVAELAASWFVTHLAPRQPGAG